MGSIPMDFDDLVAVANAGVGRTLNNLTTICTTPHRIHSPGVFTGANPLEFSAPLLLSQLAISAGTICLFYHLLKPLGQPLIVSQILGGLVLGSSGLCHLKIFRDAIFPLRGFLLLDVVSSFGNVFYFFLLGVQMDMSILKKINKGALGIGSCSVILPVILTFLYSIASMNFVDIKTAISFMVVGGTESFINFPMIASLLSELNLLNSEFGKIALSSSMASCIFNSCFLVIGGLASTETQARNETLLNISTSIVIVIVTIFGIRHVISWMIKKQPIGEPLKESFVITLLIGVLVTAFCSQACGLSILFGPYVLGTLIPPGPPFGSTLVEKLDFLTSWVFMPIFFVEIGLVVNIYAIKLKHFLGLSLIISVGALGKFIGAFLVSIYCKLPTREALSLGLIMNSQGAFELGMFKMMRKEKRIDCETFSVMCLYLMVLVAIITPIVRYLFDPSRRYVVYKRRTVMHSRPVSDLRVLVCIHDEDDVPNAINLLEALNPTRRSHLVVYMLHLVELLGCANPQLIPHKLTNVRTSRFSPSEHIVNAFKYFGQRNREVVEIYPFTAMSPSATMHDDVYSLALDRKTSLILVPFHKRFHSNGVVSLSECKMQTVNQHILDTAPCSVALVVDRGNLNVSKSIVTNLGSFQIAVVFVGGSDDREAMFIGARMAGHPNINLTMIRLLESSNVPSDGSIEERRLDNEALVEFRESVADNYRVRYIEEVVKDGNGTVCVLRSMGSGYNLVMVGRRHSASLVLVQGLVLWNEHTELGDIGEVLATSDFMGNAIILIVQQHTKVANEDKENNPETVVPMDRYLDDAKELSIHSKS